MRNRSPAVATAGGDHRSDVLRPAETRPRRWRRGEAQQLVSGWLMERIRSGHFAPGDQVPTEPQLCALLGVSRSAVRDAVQRLVAANLLEIRAGTGTFVRASTPAQLLDAAGLARMLVTHDALDLIELRLIIESAVAQLATDRATGEDLAAIRRALEVNQRAVQGIGSAVDADERFHSALAVATHNGAIVDLMALLNRLFRFSRERTSAVPGADERAYRAHVDVFRAVVARDVEAAKRAMTGNLDELRRHVVTEARQIVAHAASVSNTGDRADSSETVGERKAV